MPIRVLLLTLLLAAAAAGQGGAMGSGQDCAQCHLEWSEGFTRPQAVLLVDKPTTSTAADARTCLGCHDGSVSDSRCKVYMQAGHAPGAIPPAGMTVPAELPLDDGKITCRTCHTAHATGSTGSLADSVFLRMGNDRGQLCAACHTDQAAGPKTGSHPIATMPVEMPKRLADAGARARSRAGADRRQVACQSCHVAHGGTDKKLLLPIARGADGCVECHQQLKPLMWKPGAHEHTLDMAVRDPAQRKAIADMGTSLGQDGRLTCLTCHKVHHGTPGQAMLADTLADSRLCIRCHPGRAEMAGSSHDLRKSAPAERNSRGQTAQQSGPCGACHTVHSYTRARTPRDGDPQGLCTTCHAEGQVAAKHSGLPLSHPGEVDQGRIPVQSRLSLYPSMNDPARKALACATCHDPHDTKHPAYLREDRERLCADCHQDKARSLAWAHDLSQSSQRNALGISGAQSGKCGFCHSVHKANGPAMWAATTQKPASADETCTLCHRTGGIAGKMPAARFGHPTATAHPTTQPALPLFDKNARHAADGAMACSTCHDPHLASAGNKSLLRPVAGGSLCTQCHAEQVALAGGRHDPAHAGKPWPVQNRSGQDLCMSCHVAHSSDPARETWAFPLAKDGPSADRACLACHADRQWAVANSAAAPGATMHPSHLSERVQQRMAQLLPLASSASGRPPDRIACASCHNPHARPGTPAMLAVGEKGGQLCVSCHTNRRAVEFTMHAGEVLDPDHSSPGGCGPCHPIHMPESPQVPSLMSARREASPARAAERICLSCHGPAGAATRLQAWQHPATFSDRAVPLPSGKPLPAMADITCTTCHLTHGQAPDVPVPAGTTQADIRSGWKLMLRSGVDQKVCASCHGTDAPRRLLYFHEPRLLQESGRLTSVPGGNMPPGP